MTSPQGAPAELGLTVCVPVQVCFLESVDKATLCCPMCRKRVSTWARLHSRNNTLVNETLWRRIQTCFPRQCEHHLSGQGEAEDPHSGNADTNLWLKTAVCEGQPIRKGTAFVKGEGQTACLTEAQKKKDYSEM